MALTEVQNAHLLWKPPKHAQRRGDDILPAVAAANSAKPARWVQDGHTFLPGNEPEYGGRR